MSGLHGRQVAVLGAGGALGDGLVASFAAAGAHVLALGRSLPADPQRIEHVDYRRVDVLDEAALAEAFDAAAELWAVVNTVGGFAGKVALRDLDAEELTEQLRLNLTTAALVTKHALRRLTERGAGRLIHTASRAALVTAGSGFAYSVSKLGVVHLVEMAARETHGSEITVNAVVPSLIDTSANRAAMPDAPHEKWPSVDEIAPVYEFLASPAAATVSGASVPVYGRS